MPWVEQRVFICGSHKYSMKGSLLRLGLDQYKTLASYLKTEAAYKING